MFLPALTCCFSHLQCAHSEYALERMNDWGLQQFKDCVCLRRLRVCPKILQQMCSFNEETERGSYWSNRSVSVSAES